MSRNYQEDQQFEIGALDSIYCGELEILQTEPYKFKIPISTERFDKTLKKDGLACKLLFTYTPNYPDEAPFVEIDESINFTDDYENRLLTHIHKSIQDNLGMEMIFLLVCSAQEWLNERWDDYKRIEEEKEQRAILEAEEADRKKFEGTRVTVDTFMKWRTAFEITNGIMAKREKNNEGKKLTGRELFLRDDTLNDSDLKYLIESGDNIENVKIDESLFKNISDNIDTVKIDESLFKNITDLDLDESDEDDEDWEPDDDQYD